MWTRGLIFLLAVTCPCLHAENFESMISISTETQYIVEPNVNIKIVVTIKLYRNVSSVELFFGDETASKIYENELYIDNSTDTTAVFDKLYSSQGNYTLKASVVYAGVEYQKVTDIYVWEQLYVILTVPNKFFSTEETVSFSFRNVPREDFNYAIGFGNGESITYNKSTYEDDFNSNTHFSQMYYLPGTYQVTLTAWNVLYSQSYSLDIYLQVRIPYKALSLRPYNETIPIPDGRIEFLLRYSSSKPNPTDVVCKYHYGDIEETEYVDFTNNSSFAKEHFYSTAGTKIVLFRCFNAVSSESVRSIITVKSYSLKEFDFSYNRPTPMSMALKRVTPSDEYRHYYRSVVVPVNVTFTITLLDFRWFPPGIEVWWDFDDETGLDNFILKDQTRTHVFSSRRGTYNMTVKMNDSNSGLQYKHYVHITLGVIAFSCYPSAFDLRSENVTLIATGIQGDSNYTFDVDSMDLILPYLNFDNVKNNLNKNWRTFKNTTKYSKYGFYMPSVLGSNGERVYVDQPIIADLSLSDGLELVVIPHNVPLPPGSVTFRIELRENQRDRPFVTCNMTSGDAVDRVSVFYKKQNVTRLNPVVFKYTYTSLGNHTATLVCTNYISSKKWMKTVSVINKCFNYNGVYDRQYSIPTDPMYVYTSEKTYIANKMHIMCDDDLEFNWTFFRANIVGKTNESVNYENPMKPLKGVLFAKQGTFVEGLYYLLLNITLKSTWITEYTYIQFLERKPFAYIQHGHYRISNKQGKISFNANEKSHASYGDYGENLNLTFTWSCERISAISLSGEEILIDYQIIDECSLLTVGHGIAEFSGIPTDIAHYAITVTVNEGLSQDTFTQILTMQDHDETTMISINCSLNCKDKAAVSSKLSLVAWCESCSFDDDLQYDWRLWQDENGLGRFTPLQHLFQQGTNQQGFVIPKNVLSQGASYIVTLAAKSADKTEGKVFRKIQTNTAPSGGICTFAHKIESVPLLSVNCSGWTDDDGDGKAMTYRYETVTKRQLNKGIIDVISIHYDGSESSILDVPIQAGDQDFEYLVTVRVRIFDIYGDYGTYSKELVIRPPNPPLNEINVGKIQLNFADFTVKYIYYNRSGNDLQTINLIGAMASTFERVSYTDESTTEEDVMRGIDHLHIDNSLNEPIFIAYREKALELLQCLQSTLHPGCSQFNDRFSLTDIQQIYSTLEAITRYQPYISLEAVNRTTDILVTVNDCLLYATRRNPPPVKNTETISDVVTALFYVLDNILDKMLPSQLQNFDEPLSEEGIKEDILRRIRQILQESSLLRQNSGNVTVDYGVINRQSHLIFQLRARERIFQAEQRKTAESCFPKIKRLLSVATYVLQNTLVVGERYSFQNGLGILEIIINKLAFKDVIREPEKYCKGVFKSNGSEYHDSDIYIGITSFLKNPYIYGGNSSAVTSVVPIIKVPVNISVDARIPNKAFLEYKKYIPLINPAYPEQMIFFTFDVTNDGDSVIIYFKPDDYDRTRHRDLPLYSFYFRADTFPTLTKFDLKKTLEVGDWTEYGFKIFIQSGVCEKGICYLGIKPLKAPEDDPFEDFEDRRKREAVSFNTTISPVINTTNDLKSAEFIPAESNFSAIFITTGCRTWSDENNTWKMEGCEVLPLSDLNDTVCRCVGETFSSSFYVPPNVINFLMIWNKFDFDNASVYGMLIAVFVIYILLAIILHRQDEKNKQHQVAFLCDHKEEHWYFYLINVYTGFRRGAGTKSNVFFHLTGDYGDSGDRFLNDGKTEGFPTSSVRMFFFGTRKRLGELRYLKIWHDNSGPSGFQGWFLNKVTIKDLQTNKRYTFQCNKWLALDDKDCTIERYLLELPNEHSSLPTLLKDQSQRQMSEHHLWMSLFFRSDGLQFSSVQKLSCLLALVCLVMVSNAMFFKSSKEEQHIQQFKLGILRFSASTFYVSFMGVLISTSPIIFATMIFQHAGKMRTITKSNNEKKDRLETDSLNLYSEIFREHKTPLSHLLLFLAWFVIVIAVVSSSFFLILYSMEWGKEKSEEWLSSFFFSFLESVLVVDPVKVLLITILSLTILKHLKEEDNLKVDLEKLGVLASYSGTWETEQNIEKRELPRCSKISKNRIRKLRKKYEDETNARSALRELLSFTIYIIAIYIISVTERDKYSFGVKQNIENYLLYGRNGFNSINNTRAFYDWMNKTFIPAFYPVENYAGGSLRALERQWFKDMSGIRVGPARMRQVRMKESTCSYHKLTWPYTCVDSYIKAEEDRNAYCLGWQEYNKVSCGGYVYKYKYYTSDSWTYMDASDIWGMTIKGEYNSYGGGGYILKFVRNRENAHLLLEELLRYDWINRQSRAVSLEFTLFNPNVNLFGYVILLVEFTELGSVLTWSNIHAFKPVLSLSSLNSMALLCYATCIVYYIYLPFNVIWNFSVFGWSAWIKMPWNIVDCLSIILAYSAIAAFILRMEDTNTAINMFYEDKSTGANRFINYGHIVVWDTVFNVLLAVLVFLSTLKILKIVGYNKRFTEITAVISRAGKELLTFGTLLITLFFAFVSFAYLLFGSKLVGYKSMFKTCVSLVNTFIGRNKLRTLVEASPTTAEFFYMAYVVIVIMFMLTIFMSILNSSIKEVRLETAKHAVMFGMIKVLKKTFREFLQLFYIPKRKNQNKINVSEEVADDVDLKATLQSIRQTLKRYERMYVDDIENPSSQIVSSKEMNELPP